MTRDEILRKFPKDFPVDLLPEGAKEENIIVYRICRTGKVEEASFLPTYLDELSQTKENEDVAPEIGYYSMSTYEKPRDARRRLKFFRGKQPCAIAAKGVTNSGCGLVQRSRERGAAKDSHVDWWLYKGARPYAYFYEVDLEALRKEGAT